VSTTADGLDAAATRGDGPQPTTTAGAVGAAVGAVVGGVPIEFERVSRSFGAVTALRDVTLSVGAGEIVALLGPSGSGKSTLLRICAGLEEPTSGDLRFDGVSQLGVPPHRRDVSMVFQHFALYPHKTALDNLTLALRHGRGLPKAAALARARETLRLLGISELADRRPAAMSGGQRQRVAIGRALATRARVILLDEPMSGLDAQLRVDLRVEIVDLLRGLGTTALFVTHDQAEAMAIGDRVAVLGDGRLQQIGMPDDVYDRPATRFVAGFVGSPPMNIWDGRFEAGRLRGDGFDVPAPAGATAFGVRPEHLTLDAAAQPGEGEGEGPGGLSLTGQVVVAERLGAERAVYLRCGDQKVAMRVDAALVPRPGTPVTLHAPIAALTYFDADGLRLGPR
jgi:multiple sugar transport system ATP-binding protein